jgi:DNA polymerase-3 subunit alpha
MEFTVIGSKIRFGLVAVKNVGESAIESIIEARKEKTFDSLYEFCERVDLKKVNKRVVESLIKCGAFDSTGVYRSRLMAALEDVIDCAQRVQKERSDPQMGLFDMGDSKPEINFPSFPEIDEWSEKQLLSFEKESLGFYITGHPLTRYKDLLAKFTNADTISLQAYGDGGAIRIGGLIRNTKIITTKKGDPMAFVTIEDLHGSAEITIFSSVYSTVNTLLVDDSPILVQGQVQKDENSVKILADTVIPAEKAEETWTADIHFNLDITHTPKDLLVKLRNILEKHPGPCRAYLNLRDPGKTEIRIALPDSVRLKPGSALRQEVCELLGYHGVETVCSPVTPSPKFNNNRSRTKGNSHYA